jgi:hypothetical protein
MYKASIISENSSENQSTNYVQTKNYIQKIVGSIPARVYIRNVHTAMLFFVT